MNFLGLLSFLFILLAMEYQMCNCLSANTTDIEELNKIIQELSEKLELATGDNKTILGETLKQAKAQLAVVTNEFDFQNYQALKTERDIVNKDITNLTQRLKELDEKLKATPNDQKDDLIEALQEAKSDLEDLIAEPKSLNEFYMKQAKTLLKTDKDALKIVEFELEEIEEQLKEAYSQKLEIRRKLLAQTKLSLEKNIKLWEQNYKAYKNLRIDIITDRLMSLADYIRSLKMEYKKATGRLKDYLNEDLKSAEAEANTLTIQLNKLLKETNEFKTVEQLEQTIEELETELQFAGPNAKDKIREDINMTKANLEIKYKDLKDFDIKLEKLAKSYNENSKNDYKKVEIMLRDTLNKLNNETSVTLKNELENSLKLLKFNMDKLYNFIIYYTNEMVMFQQATEKQLDIKLYYLVKDYRRAFAEERPIIKEGFKQVKSEIQQIKIDQSLVNLEKELIQQNIIIITREILQNEIKQLEAKLSTAANNEKAEFKKALKKANLALEAQNIEIETKKAQLLYGSKIVLAEAEENLVYVRDMLKDTEKVLNNGNPNLDPKYKEALEKSKVMLLSLITKYEAFIATYRNVINSLI